MPTARRSAPMWRQIADYYKDQIVRGELREGDPIPPVRAVAAEWQVSQGTAQQALGYLRLAEKLVRADATGTYVGPPRAVLGPQQRLRLAADASAPDTEVRSAEVVPCPDYLATHLGVAEGGDVVRRETLVRRPGGAPGMLSVTWYPAQLAHEVPELLHAAPLPDPRGGAYMVAARAGKSVDRGAVAAEARMPKDDSREAPLLELAPGECLLAGVCTWRDEDGAVLEHEEFVLPPGQVLEGHLEP